MQKFWYNSTVKFFRSESQFYDVLNPQNVQFFGSVKPIILEVGAIQRFLFPDDNNTVNNSLDFYLYVVDEFGKQTQIPCDVKVVDSKVKYITFQCDESISGTLHLFDFEFNLIYYSNCVQFINTEIFSVGVKYARVITKHNYKRQLFDFTEDKTYFVTNLPMYEIGNYGMDAEISNERIAGNSTLAPKETYLDEVSRYEIKMNGNPDYVNFLQSSVTNIDFYLNGTKRTSTEQMEVDDNNTLGQISFTNQKDFNGYNITIDEEFVFSDLNIVEENRFPVNQSVNTEANISILNNRISVTFNKVFVIQPNREAKIYKDGVLVYTKSSNNMYSDNYTLIINDTLLNSSDLVLTEGDYIVVLDSEIVKTGFGKTNLQISNWTFQISENTQTANFAIWIEGGNQDKVGNDTQVSTTLDLNTAPIDLINTQWQHFDGNNWIDAVLGDLSDYYIFTLQNGLNQFRNVATDVNSIQYISNVLNYTKSITPTLISVTKLNSNSGRFVWNNNGIDYGSGSTVFQLSTDNGLNWQNFYTDVPGTPNTDNSLDINSNILSTVPDNTIVKFRIVNSGNGLVNITSNVVELIWTKTANIYITNIQKLSDNSISYILNVEGSIFNGYVITSVYKGFNTNVVNCDVTQFGDNIAYSNIDTSKIKSISINPGIYPCNIKSQLIPSDINEEAYSQAFIGYSLTPIETNSSIYVWVDSFNPF